MPEVQSKVKGLAALRQWTAKHKTFLIISAIVLGVTIPVVYNLHTGNLKSGVGKDEIVTESEKRNKQGEIIETTKTTTHQDAKTLWDWLSLLGVPVSLTFLGFILQQLQQSRLNQQARAEKEIAEQQAKVEKEIAESNQRDEALQAYFDRLSELLIDKNLIAEAEKIKRESGHFETQEKINAAKDVIRARTLSILRRLKNDGERKSSVIRFLSEAEVVSKLELDLSDTDLSDTDLSGINLIGAKLIGANLCRANLNVANLSNANLSRAKLINASLICTDLSAASLSGADLSNAVLTYAPLIGTDLSGAKFINATLSDADLSGADLRYANLTGANFSDTDFNGNNLSGADFRDAKNLTDTQLQMACLCRTNLPQDSKLNPNRNCEQLKAV